MSEATIRYKDGRITKFRPGDKILIIGREIRIIRATRHKWQFLWFHGDWEKSPVFLFFLRHMDQKLATVLMQIISFSSGLCFRVYHGPIIASRINDLIVNLDKPTYDFAFELYKLKELKTEKK